MTGEAGQETAYAPTATYPNGPPALQPARPTCINLHPKATADTNMDPYEPTSPASPDCYKRLVNTMDETARSDYLAAVADVRDLADKIKWPRTGRSHVRKAALYMSAWTQATTHVSPATQAAELITAAIVAGVRPTHMQHKVQGDIDELIKNHGGKIPWSSIPITGSPIIRAAKELDATEQQAIIDMGKAGEQDLHQEIGKLADATTSKCTTTTTTTRALDAHS